MRFLTLLFVASFLLPLTVSAKKTKVQGTVLDGSAKGKEIVFQAYGLPFDFDAVTKTELNEDGSFFLEFDLKQGSYYYIIYNRRNTLIYLTPGDELGVSFAKNDLLNTINFTGKGSEINNYLKRRHLKEVGTYAQKNNWYTKTFSEYNAILDKNKKEQTEALAEFAKGKKIKGDLAYFLKLEQANIDGLWGTYYTQYPSYHAYHTKTDPKEQWGNIDADLVEANIKDDPELLASKAYRDFLNQVSMSYTDRRLNEAGTTQITRPQFISQVYDDVEKVAGYAWLKEYLKARIIFEQVDKNGLDGMEKAIEDARKNVTQKSYAAAVEKAVSKWERVKPGTMATDILGVDVDGNEVKLSDFKGKIVYIDVWATWCGPCRREIPFLEKMEKDFHDEDVVFLSVSIDKDKTAWEKMVRNDEMKGTQIHTPGAWGSDLCKTYNITGIPRFMLIDKEGKIITTNATRPSKGAAAVIQSELRK